MVVGFIIVHLGTLISIDDFRRQWRTLIVGIVTVLGIGVALLAAAALFGDRAPGGYEGVASALDFVIAGTGALSGGTISVLIVQEAALGYGLTAVAIFPVLIAALQGLVGFPLTSVILRREAQRLKQEYRAGDLRPAAAVDARAETATRLPAALRTTAGTLLVIGLVVLVSIGVNDLTDGVLNTFVVALLLGITLRATGVLKPSTLAGIDALGLMMISILILVFAPLAGVSPADVRALALPLLLAFVFGLAGIALFAGVTGKLLGYSVPMSIGIGLTALYGFPGTLILSQEAARGAGETPQEVAAIEGDILPKMIVAGFSTVTITSVVVTSMIAGGIGR
ncbi:hypothetical protein [Cellulomonas sp. NS3]|uniref:hypothetical protein n=1 Tax=Cellulomonas sp. NS3 TaxID=2973977 RepID=UPI00216170F3|nr:hypothetical protein [Cellulomonas sp. NS3]